MTDDCARCYRTRRITVRGMCHNCYTTCRRNGSYIQFPVSRRYTAELAEDVLILWGRGYDINDVAGKTGLQPASVVRMLERHRADLVAAGEGTATLDRVLVPLRAQLDKPWPRERRTA